MSVHEGGLPLFATAKIKKGVHSILAKLTHGKSAISVFMGLVFCVLFFRKK
jgi:hypothetical protein